MLPPKHKKMKLLEPFLGEKVLRDLSLLAKVLRDLDFSLGKGSLRALLSSRGECQDIFFL